MTRLLMRADRDANNLSESLSKVKRLCPWPDQGASDSENPMFSGAVRGVQGDQGGTGISTCARVGEKHRCQKSLGQQGHLGQGHEIKGLDENVTLDSSRGTLVRSISIPHVPIIDRSDGCSLELAIARALAEAGHRGWSDLADAHRIEIEHQLAMLPPASTDHGRRPLKVTIAFLGTAHRHQAIRHGWPLIELFGICPRAPLVRIERRGLVSGLTLSKMNGGQLETIHEDHAAILFAGLLIDDLC